MARADHPAAAWIVAGFALALAAAGARDSPGGYNDASRLATAESLIERRTLAIDDSVFVQPPPGSPIIGTRDRVLVGGRFYSDKPMIPAVLVAGTYRVFMIAGLPRPGERPDVFTRVTTILTSGLGYAVAVGCMWVLGGRAGLACGWRLAWLAAFALGTVVPAYTRELNASMPLLAAVAAMAVLMCRSRWTAAGLCAGFAYAVDLASGAPLIAAGAAGIAMRARRPGPVAAFLLGAVPWIIAHHAVNFSIAGVWVPLNMVPEFLEWPGSPFDRSNMTGLARHTPYGLAVYVRDLLIGDVGLLVYNVPLVLAAACGWRIFLRPGPDRIELAALLAWSAAVFALYAVLSDNWGGVCLSVRWFVPMLVPGFWLLARLIDEFPRLRVDFAILAGWGFVVGALTLPAGPWLREPAPRIDLVAIAALGSWGLVRTALLVARKRTNAWHL